MKAHALLLALMLFSLVLVSGCVQPTQTSGGVVINSFEPDFPEVYSGEPVKFTLLVQNTGSVKATSVHGEVLNIDEVWNSGEEKLPNEPECQYTGQGFELLPPSPSFGTEGETHMCTWSYKAPALERNFEMTYYPTARVFYKYMSSVIKSVSILRREEMKALQDTGNPLPTETKSYTSSPVMIDVESRGPIRAFSDSVKFPFTIKVTNVGGGMVCREECKKADAGGMADPESNWNKMVIKIETDDTISFDCGQELEIDLYKGQSNTIVCEATAFGIPNEPAQKEIRVYSEYDYATDKQIQVKVTGV